MKTKIQVLKEAIKLLQKGSNHIWGACESCNAGILAQACLGVEDFELRKMLPAKSLWKDMARKQESCSITGIPMNVVFKALFDIGFTAKEIGDVEFLADESILKVTGKQYELYYQNSAGQLINSNFSDTNALIDYLKAWCKLLEQQPREAKIQLADKVRRVYVTVSPEVKKGELVNVLN